MRILNAVCFDISVHDGINGESGYRFDSQFLGNVLPVTDDRGKADIQFLGNFLVDESFGDAMTTTSSISMTLVVSSGIVYVLSAIA